MLPYQQELRQLIGGQIRYAGLTREGYPYIIVAKPEDEKFFYVIAQCDAEGNGAGFLQLTERGAIATPAKQ